MMPRTLVAILLLTLTPLAAQEAPRTQQPSDFKGVELKNKAPVSSEILKVKFRRPAESRLKNGMELLILEDTDRRRSRLKSQCRRPA